MSALDGDRLVVLFERFHYLRLIQCTQQLIMKSGIMASASLCVPLCVRGIYQKLIRFGMRTEFARVHASCACIKCLISGLLRSISSCSCVANEQRASFNTLRRTSRRNIFSIRDYRRDSAIAIPVFFLSRREVRRNSFRESIRDTERLKIAGMETRVRRA